MKRQLNRELIEGLNESSNHEFLDNINEMVYDIMDAVLEDISLKTPFVRADKCVLIPVNEIYTGAVSQLSEISYFLGIHNPEIEFNSKRKKNFWKNLWREFRACWRLGKKKYKKQKNKNVLLSIDKYKLSDFRHDLVNGTANYLTDSSIIYEYSNHFSMIGSNDFGTNIKINIYVCCYEPNTKTFKLYNQNKNKFFDVNFGKRFENIDAKIERCGDIFVKMIKIFNALFSKNCNRIPHQVLVESLIWNCPDLLFDKNDVYKTFVNIANYIRLADPQSLKSICGNDKHIFEDPIIVENNMHLDFGKIIGMLDAFKY